jgi:hypothetical protein
VKLVIPVSTAHLAKTDSTAHRASNLDPLDQLDRLEVPVLTALQGKTDLTANQVFAKEKTINHSFMNIILIIFELMSKGAPGKDGFNGLPGANGKFFFISSNLNRFLFNY